MGVQFFGGKFFKCVDSDGEILPTSVSTSTASNTEINLKLRLCNLQ